MKAGNNRIEDNGRMRKNSNVSIIILTKNSSSTLEACLKSICGQEPGEIVAVDMLSTDDTVQILKRYNASILINDGKSIGYSRALGVKASLKPLVMFVDSDVVLEPGSTSTMVSELAEHHWAGINAKVFSLRNETYWQRAEDENFMSFNQEGPKHHIGMAASLFRRDLLTEYPFDPALEFACEDKDVCERLRNDKYVVGVSSAVAYHLHRREFRAFFKQRFRFGRGDAQFALKSGSIPIAFEMTGCLVPNCQKSVYTEV